MANKNFTVKNGLDVGGQEVITSSGTITSAALGGQVLGTSASPSFANITTAGYLRGPGSFVIDPAAHGDDTGTVVIAGNLQVDGTQTTINSTTMTVDDLNLTLASGAANAAAANGAGITVDITGATNPSLVYGSSNDDWTFNKNLNVTGDVNTSGLLKVGGNDSEYANNYIRFKPTGAAYIDHNTVGQDINFRLSNASSLDKTPLVISPTGIDVTGTATMDGLTTSGNILLDGSGNPTVINKTSGAGNNPLYRLQADTNYWDMLGVFSDADNTFRIRYNNVDAIKIANNGDISFYEDTGTTPKFFWDASAEALSIGTSTAVTDRRFQVTGSNTSLSATVTQFGIVNNPTFTNTITNNIFNLYTGPNISSGATLGNLYNLYLEANNFGGSTVTNSFGLYQAGASDKNYFAGNVGIGTSSPSAKLEVAGSSNSTYLKVGGDDSSNGRALTFTSSASASFNGAVHTINATSSQGVIALATAATERMRASSTGLKVGTSVHSAVTTLDVHSSNFGLPPTSGTGFAGMVRIGYNDNRVWNGNEIVMGIINASAQNYAGYIQCKVPSNGTGTRPFLINPQGGNVAIGTSSSLADGLTIRREGSDKRTLLQLDRPNTAGLQTNIKFSVSNIMVGQIQHEYVASNYNHMSFTLRSPGGADVIPLWLENSGNVGIGTQQPGFPLDVSASIGSTIGQTSTYNYGLNRNWAMRTNNYGSSNWGGWSLEQSTGAGGAPTVARIGVHLNGNVGINMGGDASSGLTDINPATALHVGGDVTVGSADSVGTGGTSAIRFVNDNERSRITSNYASGGGGQMGFWTDTTGGSLLQRMTIRNSGVVTMPYQPYANASSNSTVAAIAGIPLNTNGRSRGGLTISGNRMTVPVAGAYVIGYQHLGNSGSGAFQMGIRVNNTEIGGSRMQDTNSSNDSCGTQVIKELAANDYIEFYVVSGTSHGNPAYNSMWAYLIG